VIYRIPPLTAALMLAAAPANAAPWHLSAGAGPIVLGHKEAPTIALMPEVRARGDLVTQESFRLSAGVSTGALLFQDTLGVLGGVAPIAEWSPRKDVWLSGSIGLDAGSVPICSRWGFCPSYLVLTPQATLGAAYSVTSAWSVEAGVRARYIVTDPWRGIGWQPTFLVTGNL
jgi:hypothetical protein